MTFLILCLLLHFYYNTYMELRVSSFPIFDVWNDIFYCSSVHTLLKILAEKFPYILHKNSSQAETYVQNILHVTIYCPSIRSSVLSLVAEKMIQLDVSCLWPIHVGILCSLLFYCVRCRTYMVRCVHYVLMIHCLTHCWECNSMKMFCTNTLVLLLHVGTGKQGSHRRNGKWQWRWGCGDIWHGAVFLYYVQPCAVTYNPMLLRTTLCCYIQPYTVTYNPMFCLLWFLPALYCLESIVSLC